MDIILCHTTADFDTLGAAVGLSRLLPGSRIVLAGGAHPTVRDFLALHRDEYALVERRSVHPQQITGLHIVDTQRRSRLGKTAEWLDLPQVRDICVYDHHGDSHGDSQGVTPGARQGIAQGTQRSTNRDTTQDERHPDRPSEHQSPNPSPEPNPEPNPKQSKAKPAEICDIAATSRQVEAVGAAATLIAEKLQAAGVELNPIEATVMALGIHVDTGSLTFDHSTARDAVALAWLMGQGATVRLIADYVNPSFSQALQELLTPALDRIRTTSYQSYTLATLQLELPEFLPGLSSFTSQLLELTDSATLLLGVTYPAKGEGFRGVIIGRSTIEGTDLGQLFQAWGGGGHPKAASLTLREPDMAQMLAQLQERLIAQIPPPLCAQELMSSPVRTIRPSTTFEESQRILLRYGHSGLSVVNASGELVGIISRRDLDLALHHGFGHAPVKGYMTLNPKTIHPNTSLPEIEDLMVTFDIGRLPVLSQEDPPQLVGIVTRTDVLRQRHQQDLPRRERSPAPQPACPWPTQPQDLLRSRLLPDLWELLQTAAAAAHRRGWHLYLVGGGVRDLLLDARSGVMAGVPLRLSDIDLVVDGFQATLTEAAGVELAQELQQIYPQARLEIHGRFQTAALLWHQDPVLGSLWIDIATARTEFYPYPAANPEVESSSIQQDLYRRDFTINALALRLTAPRSGLLLDYFGGLLDLQAQQVRVLHANSFIEDPTRIYRAVRFAVRLSFRIESQTLNYIRYALESGVYERTQGENPVAPALQTRLRAELQLILSASYWQRSLQLLGDLKALRCLHSSLNLTPELWRRVRLVDRYLGWLQRQAQSEGQNPAFLIPAATASPVYPWLLRLEAILTGLEGAVAPRTGHAPLGSAQTPDSTAKRQFDPGDIRRSVATKLQLPAESIDRLTQLEYAVTAIEQTLPQCDRPSQVYRCLKPYDAATLSLVAVQVAKPLRRKIWRYLTHWLGVRPPLSGEDLKRLGYRPGPQFKVMLETVLAATLDGTLDSTTEPTLNQALDRATDSAAHGTPNPTSAPAADQNLSRSWGRQGTQPFAQAEANRDVLRQRAIDLIKAQFPPPEASSKATIR